MSPHIVDLRRRVAVGEPLLLHRIPAKDLSELHEYLRDCCDWFQGFAWFVAAHGRKKALDVLDAFFSQACASLELGAK